MNFEECNEDTHSKETKVFTAPKDGLYTITNTVIYVNSVKFGIWANKAKRRGIRF